MCGERSAIPSCSAIRFLLCTFDWLGYINTSYALEGRYKEGLPFRVLLFLPVDETLYTVVQDLFR
jgi:hypothetical protein